MEVHRVHDALAFLTATEELLVEDEVRHNLVLGIAATIRDHPATFPAFDLWVIDDDGSTVGAALHTPPFSLVIARPAHEGALGALAEAIAAAGVRPAGVNGALPEAPAFAERWVERAGGTWRSRVELGVYSLRQVRPVPVARGRARTATSGDVDVVLGMIEAFADDVGDAAIRDPAAMRRTTEARLTAPPDQGGFWFWEDAGEIVSLSGHGGPTPHGIRIGPVYTPPERRREGFATSLVAEQSAWLLAHGRRFCFLYTDLANPTSNAIYRRIGYDQVCEAADLSFDPPA
ncbi:MAG: GNAT family N-acetyltransferase [Actinomycetota bacterium]